MIALSFTGTEYIAACDFSEKDTVKAAGFRWRPETKQWWTNDEARAAKLAKFAHGDVGAKLAKVDAVRQDTLTESRATDASINIPVPEGLSYLPYQRAGIAFMAKRPRVLLGDDMGLGKTIQIIGLMNIDPSIQRTLVICPASLRLNWYKEMRKWLVRPLQIAIASTDRSFPSGFHVVIINYDILRKFEYSIRRESWDLLVADESHYLKSEGSIRSRMVFGYQPRKKDKDQTPIEPIQARRVVLATGTPITNRPKEIYPLIHFLDPATWSNGFLFTRRYCNGTQNRFGYDASGSSNLGELQDKLRSSCLLRRLKGDVLKELPPKRRQVIEMPANGAGQAVAAEMNAWRSHEDRIAELRLSVELAKASDDIMVYRAAVAKLQEGVRASFTEMAKLRHDTALAKVPYVNEHIKDCLDSGDKLLVFAHHIDVIDAIVKEFPGKVVKLDGRDSMEARNASVERFQKDPTIKLFVGGIMAAGVGLTLTAASHAVFAELDWVPANITQGEDRLHRIGQRNSVLIQHLVLEGSLDARMVRILVEKQEVIDRALDKQEAEADAQMELVPIDGGSHSTREAIHRDAESITPAQIVAIHGALRLLAGMCDGARQTDGAGFNKLDSRIGKILAEGAMLTPRQAALGRKIARRYKRQLGDGVVDLMFGKEAA